MLVKKNRIRLNKEFDQIFKAGQSFYGKFLGVKASRSDLPITRIGIIVGSKISKKAVDRNLIKRRIREIIRPELEKIIKSRDIVIIALPGAGLASFIELSSDLKLSLKKLRLY